MVVVTASFGMVVPLFGGKVVDIMVASQAVSPVIMPVIALLTWLLLPKKSFAGEHTNTLWMNLGMGVAFLFTLCMQYIAISGFLK